MTAPNAPAATLMPIFATPFAAVPLPAAAALNPKLAQLLRERATEARREPGVPADPLVYRSAEDLFEWQDETVASVRSAMLAGLCAAVRATTLYSSAEFGQFGLQVRARFLIVRPDGALPATTQPLASWCAVYCVATPPERAQRADSGVLRLYETRLGSMFMDPASARMRPEFAAVHHSWRPFPGVMAAFPASVTHEIALNRAPADLILVMARVRFTSPVQQPPPW